MSAQNLRIQINRLAARTKLLAWAKAFFLAAFTGLAVLIGWAWMDLLLDAPAGIRIAGFIVAAGAALGVLVVQIRKAGGQWNSNAVARRLDAAAAAKGQIVAGYDLMHRVRAPAGSPEGLAAGLAFLATHRAGELAVQANLRKAAPGKSAKRAGLALIGLLAVIGLMTLIVPGLMRAQWARLADPFGDHPDFSQIAFEVKPGNVKVIYGGDVDIRARVKGGAVDRLEAVLVSSDGTEEAVPMYADSTGLWRTSLAGLKAAGAYYVRAHQARSEKFAIDLITVPQITGVTAKVAPPAYTRQPAKEGAIPAEGIAALPQTTIEFHAKSNRPLKGGALAVQVGEKNETIPMTPVAGNETEVIGTILVTDTAKVTLNVTDTAQQDSTDAFATTITLLADQKPFVRIVEPRAQSYATPNAKLPVEVLAEDDYGITAVTLYRALNDSRAFGVDLPVNKESAKQRISTVLALSGLGLKAGDTIRLTARAEDNDPAGAKGSESDPALVQIISQEDYNRMMAERAGLEALLSKYEQARRRLEAEDANLRKLKDELAQLKPDAPLNDALRAKASDIGDAAENDANEVDDALQLKLPFDLDKQLAPDLGDVANKLHDLSSQLRQGTPKSASVKDELDLINGLIAGLDQEQKNYDQKVGEPLDYLSKIYPLIADEEKFVQLYKREDGLAQRLVGMVDNPDDPREKARLSEMEEDQRHIHEALQSLLADIQEHARQVPNEPQIDDFRKSAWDFSDAVDRSMAGNHMLDAQLALGEFWGKQGQVQAVAAAKAMKDFIAESGGKMEEQAKGALKFQPALASALGDTVGQLLAAGGLSGSGGYSMAGENPEAVGLYGSLPLEMKRGGGSASAGGPVAGGNLPASGVAGNGQTGSVAAGNGGALAVPAPPQYQKRVDEYFQRVTDELQKD